MFGSVREALLDVQEWLEVLQDVREWSGDLSGCPGVVERVPRMSGSCQEALPEVQEWLEDPPRCP